jgi:anti-sigma B factor antagonist
MSDAMPAVTQLILQGRLDATTVGYLESVLSPALDVVTANAKTALLLNLQGLTYVSSSGLRVLLSARATARRRTIRLILCALSPHVREVFDLVGFSTLFEIYESCDDALIALAQP